MANVKNSIDLADLVTQQLKQASKKEITKEQKINIEEFKNICRVYIDTIDSLISNINQRLSLMSRISLLGSLMHNDKPTLQSLVSLNVMFENALDNYLGRQNYLTWISTAASSIGEIRIADYETQFKIFGEYSNLAESGNRAKINGINLDTFKNVILNQQIATLQQKINEQTAKRGHVFGQALYRLDKTLTSTSSNMSVDTLKKRQQNMNFVEQNKGFSSSIYWRITTDGKTLNWQRVSNRGFVGEAYLNLILKHPYSGETIVYRHGNGPNPPPYNLQIHQEQIRLLASFIQQGDFVPGAIQGDLQLNGQNGKINLAIKQGPSFHTASMTIDIAIAYAFLKEGIANQLLLPETINKSLQLMVKNCKNDTTNWTKVYQLLTGISDNSILKNVLQGTELRTTINL